MTDSLNSSVRLRTAPDDSALLLKSLPAEIPYRGSSASNRVRGVARTAPAEALRFLCQQKTAAAKRARAVKLELPEGIWTQVPAWDSAQGWLEGIPLAYERHYTTRVAPVMGCNPVSLKAIVAVAAARAVFADCDTGRNCRPAIKTLVKITGYSERTVQRADQALLLLGVATEVMRGRLRTLDERQASYRSKDSGQGWASVWALHPTRFPEPLSPHLPAGESGTKPPVKKLVTTTPRRQAVAETAAARRTDRNAAGAKLARKWILADDSPTWAHRYRTHHAWASNLQAAALHGWTARDVNQAIRDFAGARWLAASPDKPIALLGAILKWYGDLSVRPAAADEAREAHELAEARARIAAAQAELASNQRARQDGLAALSGPGRSEARRIAAEAHRKSLSKKTDEVAQQVAAADAAIRQARGL